MPWLRTGDNAVTRPTVPAELEQALRDLEPPCMARRFRRTDDDSVLTLTGPCPNTATWLITGVCACGRAGKAACCADHHQHIHDHGQLAVGCPVCGRQTFAVDFYCEPL